MSDSIGKKGKPKTLGDILSGNCDENSKDVRKMKKLIKETADRLVENVRPVFRSGVIPAKDMPSPESLKSIRSRVMLMKFRLDPTSVDHRRGKKRDCLTEGEVLLRAAAIDAFHFKEMGYIKHWIDKAIATHDPGVFKVLAQVAEESKAPSHNASSRRVICALEAEIRLLENRGKIPTKQEIRLESGMELEPSRWTEIHKAAGQANNPMGKPKRGRERRGDNTLKSPPRK